jgi:hypothetical protein
MFPASLHRAPATRLAQEAEHTAYPTRAALLVAAGVAALALGLLVYLTGRVPTNASLIPAVAWLQGSISFGPMGGWLPAVAHTFAFSLFTAAAVPARRAPPYGVCLAWFAINAAFEIGQHRAVSAQLAGLLQAHLDGLPFRHSLASYFVRGTFDPRDIAAALIGAVAAGAMLRVVHANTRGRPWTTKTSLR